MEPPIIVVIVAAISDVQCSLNTSRTSIPHSLGCIPDLLFYTTKSQLTGLASDSDSSQQLLLRALFYSLE
jgi:hypothetical protein